MLAFALLTGVSVSAQELVTIAPSWAPTSEESAAIEVPAPAVVIEGELPQLGPTPDEMLRQFRDTLQGPPSFLSSERRLADGTLEATNRLGRFCSSPLTAAPGYGVGGDIRLFARCSAF